PADGDTVFGHAAEPQRRALGQRADYFANILDGLGNAPLSAAQLGSERLDLEPFDSYDPQSLVQQVLSERVAGRSPPDETHVLAVVAQRKRPTCVQRIPTGQ